MQFQNATQLRGERPMNTLKQIAVYFAIGMSAIGLLGAETAYAGTAGKEVVGTWTLVSATIMKDGKKKDLFGPSPQGRVVFDEQGIYTLVMMRSDIPKFANNSRKKGSPEENAAVVHGSIAHFGKYSYNEKDKTYALDIKACTYPNWNNTSQTRRLTVKGDELYWVNPKSSTGDGILEIILRRVK